MIKINNKEFLYSFSQNRTYDECPMKYYFKYYEGLKEPSNENLELGSAIHKLLELQWWNVNQDNYFELDRDAYDDAIAAEKLIKDRKGRMYLEQLLDEMSEFFQNKQILFSECDIRVDDCICKIDLIYKDKTLPNKIILADYKVTKKPKSDIEMHQEGQLLLYKYAFAQSEKYKAIDPQDDIDLDDILTQYINILPYSSFKIIEPSGLVPISMTACKKFYDSMLSNTELINSLHFPKKKKWCNWCHFKDKCNAINK